MVASKIFVGGVLAAGASAAAVDPLALFARSDLLAIRADLSPGSPAYNCHDNCGQAIIEVRAGGDVCSDNVFLTDYANCLQCAGPDNEDIWQYYGSSISAAAAQCGLSTTPLSGTQEAVGPALAAGSGSGSATTSSAAAEASTTADAETTAATTTPAETTAADTTAAASTSAAASTAAASASAPYPTGGSSTASGGAAPSGTGSSTSSAASSVVTAGASSRSVVVGLVGAAALGAAYALAF